LLRARLGYSSKISGRFPSHDQREWSAGIFCGPQGTEGTSNIEPELFGHDRHRVDRGHAGLSWAALNAGDVVTLFPRPIVLAELVVNSCQQEMGLAVFGVELRRSRQLRTRFPKAPKFEQRLAREKMSVRRIRL